MTYPDCGDKPNEASPLTDDSDCSIPCAGDATQPCGAGNRISIYNGPAGEPTPPEAIEGWAYEGCWRYAIVPAPCLDSMPTNSLSAKAPAAGLCFLELMFPAALPRVRDPCSPL